MRSDSRLAVKGTDNLREGLAAMSNESLREHYRPAHVNLLFVREAPPASGRFFYRCNSGLYRAIRGAFVAAFPTLHDLEFLESFQALGCYLVDLCDKPIDRLEKPKENVVLFLGGLAGARIAERYFKGALAGHSRHAG